MDLDRTGTGPDSTGPRHARRRLGLLPEGDPAHPARVVVAPVREAVPADVASWAKLARDVEDLFGPMPDFESVVERAIRRGTALVTGDVGDVTGGMLLSRDGRPQQITWLAVAEAARGRGLGTALVEAAIDRWPTGDIEVVTFGAGMPGGASARRLYTRAGFKPNGPADSAQDGSSRDRFVLCRGRSAPLHIRSSTWPAHLRPCSQPGGAAPDQSDTYRMQPCCGSVRARGHDQ